jgi:hypothetical protein
MNLQTQLFQESIPGFGARVLSRLANDNARDLSNSEIERVLGHCVSPALMIGYAKEIRDMGLLTLEMLDQCKKEIEARA